MARGTLKMLKGVLYNIFFSVDNSRVVRDGKLVSTRLPLGGDFGGGGATGDWPALGKDFDKLGPGLTIGVVGDPLCPDGGEYRFWDYQICNSYTWGPHPDGIDQFFTGYERQVNLCSNYLTSITYSDWQLNDNLPLAPSFPVEDVHHYPPGFPPALGERGYAALPDAYAEANNSSFIEVVAFLASARPGFPAGWTAYDLGIRGIWKVATEACQVPEPKVVYSPQPFDRFARHSYPYDPQDLGDPKKKPKDDDDGGWFIPPFVFAVPLGPPVFLPPAVGPLPGPSGAGETPPPREPPKRGDRVRKKKGTLQTIFRVLDIISESSEVVDCFFDALPKPIKNKWKKGRENRGLLDTAGQYGIDGADWKAAAIYHNWKSVDLQKALICCAVNQVADEVVGGIMRQMPPQAGATLSGWSRAEHVAKKEKAAHKWAAIRARNAAKVAAFKRRRSRS